jgi:hypothetical protein
MATVPVKYNNGQQEAIEIKPLSITERYVAIDHLVAGDTPQLVSLCIRRNLEWVNSLEIASYLELAKKFAGEVFKMAVEISLADPIAGLKVGPLLFRMSAVLQQIPEETMTQLKGLMSLSTAGASSSPTPGNASPNGNASPSAPAPVVSAEATGSAAAA